MTIIDTIADNFYGDRVQDGLRVRRSAQCEEAKAFRLTASI